MLAQIEIPKYLDVLLMLNDTVSRARIYKLLDRSATYISDAIIYFEQNGLVLVEVDPHNERQLLLKLTPKGRDVQNIIITLYNRMGITINRG